MKKFKNVFQDYTTWYEDVVKKIEERFDEKPEWINDNLSFYKQKDIYDLLFLNYKNFIVRFGTYEDCRDAFILTLWNNLPDLFVKTRAMVNNEFNLLVNREYRITESVMEGQNESKNKTKNSTTPTNLKVNDDLSKMYINDASFVEDLGKQKQTSKTYNLLAELKNIISTKINGIILDWLNNFKSLFSPNLLTEFDWKKPLDDVLYDVVKQSNDIESDVDNLYGEISRLEGYINRVIDASGKVDFTEINKILDELKLKDTELEKLINDEVGKATELINEVETRLTEKDSEIDNRVTQTRNDLSTFKQNMGYWRFVDGVDTWEFTSKKLYSTSMNDLSDGEIVNKQFLNWKVNSVTTQIVENVNNVTETIEKAITVNDKTTLNQTTEYNTSAENNDLELVNKKYLRENGASVDTSKFLKNDENNQITAKYTFLNTIDFGNTLPTKSNYSIYLDETESNYLVVEYNITKSRFTFNPYGLFFSKYGDETRKVIMSAINENIEKNGMWRLVNNNNLLEVDFDGNYINFFTEGMYQIMVQIVLNDGRIIITKPQSIVLNTTNLENSKFYLDKTSFFSVDIQNVIYNIRTYKG